MTEAERIARHEAAIERFNEAMGPAYAAWLQALPRLPCTWTPPAANDDQPAAANDNIRLDEAA